LIELEPSNNAHYALLCSVYAAAGRWEDTHRVKAIMKARDERFSPGHRLSNLNEIVHEYRVRERQPGSQEMYAVLDELASRLRIDCRWNEQSESGIE
jgi:hypothetical protein